MKLRNTQVVQTKWRYL